MVSEGETAAGMGRGSAGYRLGDEAEVPGTGQFQRQRAWGGVGGRSMGEGPGDGGAGPRGVWGRTCAPVDELPVAPDPPHVGAAGL